MNQLHVFLQILTLLLLTVRIVIGGCECTLTSPNKIPITTLGSFPNVCFTNFKGRNSCTCQERHQNCVTRCYQNALVPRDSATTAHWKRYTCQADRRIYTPPGQPLLSQAVTNEIDCKLSSYSPLYNKLACCRRGYGHFMFDNRCVWPDYYWRKNYI